MNPRPAGTTRSCRHFHPECAPNHRQRHLAADGLWIEVRYPQAAGRNLDNRGSGLLTQAVIQAVLGLLVEIDQVDLRVSRRAPSSEPGRGGEELREAPL